MRDYFIPEHLIMDFEIYDNRIVHSHQHQNPELVYVLEGSMTLAAEDRDLYLEKNDFFLINSNVNHRMNSEEDTLFVCFYLNYTLLCRYLDMDRAIFSCSSRECTVQQRTQVEKLIREIMTYYFSKQRGDQLHLNSLYYHFLDYLTRECLTYRYSSDGNRKDQEEFRINEIVNYIHANYKSHLSLNELADAMYLSPPYLSKYIKKHLQMNYTDYVNNVRLYYAVKELQQTDRKILHIAIDNGFPNITSFNKAFHKLYDMTPSEYRARLQEDAGQKDAGQKDAGQALIARKMQTYMQKENVSIHTAAPDEETVEADAENMLPLDHYWSQMINVGHMADLFSSDVQRQILMLKQDLGFGFVRMWGLYDKKLYLNIEEGIYNFNKMDVIMDFLHENHLYPYIEIGFKPQVIVETIEHFLVEEETPILFHSYGENQRFITAFLSHYVNRYGIEEVENWCFEQWKDSRTMKQKGDFSNYLNLFEAVYSAIKAISPHIRVGGGSLHAAFDRNDFRPLLAQWKERSVYPDFLTIYAYPYTDTRGTDTIDHRRDQDPDHLGRWVREIRESMDLIGFHIKELHVSEWNSTVSNRNHLNDNVFKGAYIIKNVLENRGTMQALGYWTALDIFAQEKDTNRLLTGGAGILTHDGIRKPPYFAYRFLHRLGKFEIGHNQHMLITSNGRDEYTIVTHNYCHPNYKYYQVPEGSISIDNQNQYFDQSGTLTQNLHIAHVRNGDYRIKIYQVNEEYGSILDEWIRIGLTNNLTAEELDYLRQTVTARISIRETSVTDHTLKFKTELKRNEIQMIRITYRL